MALKLENIQHCYNTLLKNPNIDSFNLGRMFGYLEAGLQQFEYLETETVDGKHNIKLINVKSNKWWKKDRKETIEEAIIRMTEKLFSDNNLIT